MQLPRFHVEEDLKAARLVELLPELASPSMLLSALCSNRWQLSPRVRVFVGPVNASGWRGVPK